MRLPACRQRRKHLTVGLVNNMPDGAVELTERQFLEFLDAAAGPTEIIVRLFSLPEMPAPNRRAGTCVAPIAVSRSFGAATSRH